MNACERQIKMPKKTFKGRPLLAGELVGKATVSKQPFNTTASYFDNMFAGVTDSAPCTDSDNKELFRKDISNCIMCTSQTIGSNRWKQNFEEDSLTFLQGRLTFQTS